MKLYLIRFTRKEPWEISTGITIISAKSKQNAIAIFNKQICSTILTISLLKITKEKVLFSQEPIIE